MSYEEPLVKLYLVELNEDSCLGEEMTSKKKIHSVFFHQSENTLKDKSFKIWFPFD